MDYTLIKIKRLVLQGKYEFRLSAEIQLANDGLTMQGDFCRMCGSKKLRQQQRNILLESQDKKIKNVSIWICQNCGEEFLDDSSREKLYQASRTVAKQKTLAA